MQLYIISSINLVDSKTILDIYLQKQCTIIFLITKVQSLCDNKNVITITKNSVFHRIIKHID